MATDDDDAATLRERVRELEQTVAQQQDTIEQLMPSRRAVLAGGAGLVGGAALTGQASAQSAAGQVGTSSEPVDVEAATVTADSVNTRSLVIGGTLYEEDGNSPWSPSGSNATYSVSGDYNEIILIPPRGVVGYNRLQVNGDTGNNYGWRDTSDAETSDDSEWSVPRANEMTQLHIFDVGARVHFSAQVAVDGVRGQRGTNQNLGGSGINQITMFDSVGNDRSPTYRVFGRDI